MEERIIITSGRKYIDIDAYAGIFAYHKLLKDLGYNVYTCTSAYINESVPKIITNMKYNFDNIEIEENDKYIVLDVSNPDFIDMFVKQDNIIEIIDHHIGYETYWEQKKIKNKIEFIGSICTIIYEKYIEYGKENLLDSNICKLLMAGILDNTLNLKSKNTTNRDIEAYYKLMELGKVNKDFNEMYFNSCYIDMENNLENNIINDIKIEKTSSLLPEVFGQLIVLDIDVILNNINKVNDIFREYEEWMFNVISLKDGKSYLFFSSLNVKNNLLTLFKGEIKDNYIILNNCMLRKEIIKASKDYENN